MYTTLSTQHRLNDVVVDLDDGWGGQCTLYQSIETRRVVGSSESAMAEPIHLVCAVRKYSIEGDYTALPLDVGDADREGLLLSRGVGQVETAPVTSDVLLGSLRRGQIR